MLKSSNGFNPLRWDCTTQGCFNKKCRPKIEVFAECFPRKINFGDVDGLVEINGKALIMEWKSFAKELPVGQRIAYRNLSRDGKISILCFAGNAETMEITHSLKVHMGKIFSWQSCTMKEAKNLIRQWVYYAENKS